MRLLEIFIFSWQSCSIQTDKSHKNNILVTEVKARIVRITKINGAIQAGHLREERAFIQIRGKI